MDYKRKNEYLILMSEFLSSKIRKPLKRANVAKNVF